MDLFGKKRTNISHARQQIRDLQLSLIPLRLKDQTEDVKKEIYIIEQRINLLECATTHGDVRMIFMRH
jgi:hypothetical protein